MPISAEQLIELPVASPSPAGAGGTFVEVTVLLDRAIVERYKALGADWQQHLERVLRTAEVK